jgi:hypothetical protein
MIDKIDGIKFLRKAADFIECCNKEKCGKCQFYDKCSIFIEKVIEFSALVQTQS